jgi:hypothetical protein
MRCRRSEILAHKTAKHEWQKKPRRRKPRRLVAVVARKSRVPASFFAVAGGYACSQDGETRVTQGARIQGANVSRDIYTMPGNMVLRGEFTLTRVR